MQDILHYDFNKAISSSQEPKLIPSDLMSYKRILIVDDSVTTRTMIKNILLNIGYTVDTVLDVEEALVKLRINHYDLIITDLNMPKIDGYEFVTRLKSDEMYADIPIIIMSSLPEKTAMQKLYPHKIEYYMQKDDFNQIEFANQIKKIITKYHL